MKKILSLILILSMIAFPALLTGCTGGEDPQVTTAATTAPSTPAGENVYTVTLVDDAGSPVAGASVMISNGTGVFISGTTDQNGQFSTETDGANLGVMVVSVPTGYEKPALPSGSVLHAMFENGKSLTITVKKESAAATVKYTVNVVDQNGAAVVGAKLQLCPNGTCLADTFVTDSTGKAFVELDPNRPILPIDVKIIELPAGYTAPEALWNGYHAKIEDGQVEVTVTVTAG